MASACSRAVVCAAVNPPSTLLMMKRSERRSFNEAFCSAALMASPTATWLFYSCAVSMQRYPICSAVVTALAATSPVYSPVPRHTLGGADGDLPAAAAVSATSKVAPRGRGHDTTGHHTGQRSRSGRTTVTRLAPYPTKTFNEQRAARANTVFIYKPRARAWPAGQGRSVRLQATAAGADGYCCPFRRVILGARGPERRR